MPQYPSQSSETYTPDRLIAGETQLVTRSYVLLSGQKLSRGTVVGQITAGGKITISLTAAVDGSQNPNGILIDDYDATAGDVAGCGVYQKGEFNENAIIMGAGWTLATLYPALRDLGIYLKPAVVAGP